MAQRIETTVKKEDKHKMKTVPKWRPAKKTILPDELLWPHKSRGHQNEESQRN